MILKPKNAVLVTGPTAYPITLVEAKAQLNFGTTVDDEFFRRLIHVVTNEAEKWTGRRFVYQIYDAYASKWPDDGVFELPFGWLQSVTEIYYTDTDGTSTLWASTEYDVNTNTTLGMVSLGYAKSFPTATLRPVNPIRIRFSCGRYHGAAWEDSTAYLEDVIVLPTGANKTGFVYQAGGDGTSDATEPTWPRTVNGTVIDNDITWTNVGPEISPVVRNALLIAIAGYYEERTDTVITQGGIMIDLARIKRQLGFLKVYY